MPRRTRVNVAGKHYVTNSSKNGQKIFGCDEDKDTFLRLLCMACERYQAEMLAYCVTDSEYHLIASLKKQNLSLLMRQVSATYSIFYNRAHNKSGSLWHDRFKSWAISEKNDLSLIRKYIANIPMLKKITNNPKEYKYLSSNTILDNNATLPSFTEKKKSLLSGVVPEGMFDEEDDAAFKQFKRSRDNGETPSKKEKKGERLEKIFKKMKDKNKRNKKIKKAFESGYSQNEIALFLKLSQSTISKIVNKGT